MYKHACEIIWFAPMCTASCLLTSRLGSFGDGSVGAGQGRAGHVVVPMCRVPISFEVFRVVECL